MASLKRSSPSFFAIRWFTVFGFLAIFACQSSPKAEAVSTPSDSITVTTTPATFEVTLSTTRPVDGALVRLGLRALTEVKAKSVKVSFEGKEFPVFPGSTEKEQSALIVIPFNSKPRSTKIDLEWEGGRSEFPIEVVDGNYPSEKLTVDEKKVNPPKRVMARIRREQKEIGALYHNVVNERYWSGAFALPIESEITSNFGNKRLYNGKMASFHQGLDLRARTPLPIRAPEGAKVVMAKDLYYTGNTVILDHGFGLFTIYAHMSRLDVRVGDRVNKSQVLGLSGGTGRASGPHLHWGAVLLREKFNPSDLTRVPR